MKTALITCGALVEQIDQTGDHWLETKLVEWMRAEREVQSE